MLHRHVLTDDLKVEQLTQLVQVLPNMFDIVDGDTELLRDVKLVVVVGVVVTVLLQNGPESLHVLPGTVTDCL